MEGEACLRVNTSSLATPDDDEPEPRNGSPRLDNRSWNAFCAVEQRPRDAEDPRLQRMKRYKRCSTFMARANAQRRATMDNKEDGVFKTSTFFFLFSFF